MPRHSRAALASNSLKLAAISQNNAADSLSHRHRAADLLALAQAELTLLGIPGLPSDAMWLFGNIGV